MKQYSYAEKDGRFFLKMTGDLKYTFSAGFDSFLDKILSTDPVDVLIDLSEAQYIDSTNLGLIARIAEFLQNKQGRKPTLISGNPEIITLLESVGFDRIFLIVPSAEPVETDFSEIPELDLDDRERARMMVKAHKNLMALNQSNRKIFQDVVSFLEQELED